MRRGSLATLTKAPNLLSLSRIPLAAAFPLASESPLLSLSVLGLSGLSDVLDGWSARKLNQHSELGRFVDPIADKIFMGSVVATLTLDGRLPPWGVATLFVREAFELVATGIALVRPSHVERDYRPRAPTRAGKLTTFAQFASAVSAVIAPVALPKVLVVAGALGFVAGMQYATREIRGRAR